METQTVQLKNCAVELSQPVKGRPGIIVVATSDGRKAVIGDGKGVDVDPVVQALIDRRVRNARG